MKESIPTSAELQKLEVLQELNALIEARCSDSDCAFRSRFVEALYSEVAPADLEGQRVEHLYAAAVSLLRFVVHRAPGDVALRVFVPTHEEFGWHTPLTVVELVNDDMPFLLASVIAELGRLGAEVMFVAHPIMRVQRDSAGQVTDVRRAAAGDTDGLDSVIHVRVRGVGAELYGKLAESLRRIVADVVCVVEDFPQVQTRCEALISDLAASCPWFPAAELSEVGDFLRWLNERHFVYLGYRYCRAQQRGERVSLLPDGPGLGLLREPSREVFEDFQPGEPHELLRILKTNTRARVHRPVHMDAVVLSDFTGCVEGDAPRGAHLLLGQFTLSGYARSTSNIPLLRRKVERTLADSGFLPRSYSYKALRYVLETYPRDELFQISQPDLGRIAYGILNIQTRRRVALFSRRDPFGRFISCLVYVPRDRFDTPLRHRIEAILCEAYGGTLAAYYTRVTDDLLARLHLIIKGPHAVTLVEHRVIEQRLHEAARSWEDHLEAALLSEQGEERGGALARTYGRAFSAAYAEAFDELAACVDIDQLERARKSSEMTLLLYRPVEASPSELCLKIFLPGRGVALSDVVPRLENMGLRVDGEVPYEVRPAGGDAVMRVHDFSLISQDGGAIELSAIREAFVDVFSAVSRGEMANDPFNKLVLYAGIQAREVNLVRAYASYLQQIDSPFSLAYMQRTLQKHAGFVGALIAYFHAKFDPDGAQGLEGVEALAKRARELLDAVASSDEDRILRAFLSVFEATRRTNYYQHDADGNFKNRIALKFDSQAIAKLPRPKPFREIFVFAPNVVGVHLRFGAVARGGLRWSDRPEDFRTEVLGLVKAQQVKNSVIVPVGSKGGFVLKRPPPASAGREAFAAAGIEAYKTFVRGLLDVTDNQIGDEVCHPERVVAYDGFDPYLVVAADKGTATFSDTANAISSEYGFWLGDAFASGGSAGYDHKKMGITARGAWEAVRRHFHELGKNVQKQPFTVCGIGDMSGDVFGNAMLLSRQTCLVAAFNHMHIFVDPNPDPEASWEERRRLFELPRSAWSDYDPSLISEGGAVHERTLKALPVSLQVQKLLGIDADSVTPNELIQAILRAPVELMFFGGIGTYVKGSTESNVQVGDRANDAVRIDAHELRAQVIGEGANLGVTQRGRVEFGLRGGRSFTDFIDNSAGVDCSDHEVNIKILLGGVEQNGDLTRKQRDGLLVDMTTEVAALVLRDNFLQTRCLSVTHHLGTYLTERLAVFMRSLENGGGLDRGMEYLPTDQQLAERKHAGSGFTRPELAVLLAYAKNGLYSEILDSPLPDEPHMAAVLLEYFPAPLRTRFRDAIVGHKLRREIVATSLTNEVLNTGGIAFVYEVQQATGARSADIVRAFVVAQAVLGTSALLAALDRLDSEIEAAVQAELIVTVGRCLTAWTMWLVRNGATTEGIEHGVGRYRGNIKEMVGDFSLCFTDGQQVALAQRVEGWVRSGVSESLAAGVATLPLLAAAGDWIEIGKRAGGSPSLVAMTYHEVGEKLGVDWLCQAARALPVERLWDRQAVVALLEDLGGLQRRLVESILAGDGDSTGAEAYERWRVGRADAVARVERLMSELKMLAAPNFAALTVAAAQLKTLSV